MSKIEDDKIVKMAMSVNEYLLICFIMYILGACWGITIMLVIKWKCMYIILSPFTLYSHNSQSPQHFIIHRSIITYTTT